MSQRIALHKISNSFLPRLLPPWLEVCISIKKVHKHIENIVVHCISSKTCLHLTTLHLVKIWAFPMFLSVDSAAAHCPSKKIGKKVQNIALHCTAYSCIVLFLAVLVTPVSSPLGHRISGNLGISNVLTLSPEWSLPSSNKLHKKTQNLVLHGNASHRCLHFTY